MFSPNLKTVAPAEFSAFERMCVIAELDLMNSADQWLSEGNALGDHYKELAIIYTSIYDDKIAMSNLLLTFKGAIVNLEVERQKHVTAKGESPKADEAYKRNKMMMRVHKEASYLVEKNQQILIMLKNYNDVNAQLAQENKTLKQQLKAVEDAANF